MAGRLAGWASIDQCAGPSKQQQQQHPPRPPCTSIPRMQDQPLNAFNLTIPTGSCGYGSTDPRLYPFYYVVIMHASVTRSRLLMPSCLPG